LRPYFQKGKGTLVQADNGTGKTTFMCAIAAHVSTGKPFNDLNIETPGDVLIISVEDDPGVLRGRIEAAGGNLDKCHFFENPTGLTFISPEVEAAVKQVNAKMVIFDPFQNFLGAGVDMNKSNQTRPVLSELFDMANRNDVSIVIIAHISKAGGGFSPANRSLGSVDIPAAMRSILHIERNPDNEKENLVFHVKCSNAMCGKTIAYTIGGEKGGVTWNGFSEKTLDDLYSMNKRKEKGVPYEREPLVQVFNQLITDRPGGGFWPYNEVKTVGMKILGFPPFSSATDLKGRINSNFARELQENDGLIVTCGHKQGGERGIKIERYTLPHSYQSSLGDD
jgi:hypothetical protein